MSKAIRTIAFDVGTLAQVETRVGPREVSQFVNEATQYLLDWRFPEVAAGSPGTEDINKKRQTFIADFKATPRPEEKAKALMATAIKDGLFSNQLEFRRALKNA